MEEETFKKQLSRKLKIIIIHTYTFTIIYTSTYTCIYVIFLNY